MQRVRELHRKFQSSDGRIKLATLSGVSALVAVIALLVGVLPVMANHGTSKVTPAEIALGGGSGGCVFVESPADESLHLNNPASGTYTGSDGTRIEVVVTGRLFSFKVLDAGKLVYDVTVNGGTKSNHYNYNGVSGVTEDKDLHAPNNPQGTPHNLSHVNICYDGNTQFECGEEEKLESQGLFVVSTVTIFGNSLWECQDKLGAFVIDNDPEGPNVLIDFGAGDGTVAGIATFEKDFGQPPAFVGLQYQLTQTDPLVDLEWCTVRTKDTSETGTDGDEFDDWLGEDHYPSLDGVTDEHTGEPGPAIACKVYEEETADGTQFTVVYFEFEDPTFR